MDSKIFSKLAGSNELPIGRMPGFHEPGPVEAKRLGKRLKNNTRKAIATTAAWTAGSILFAAMYGRMYLGARKTVFLAALAVFLFMSVMGILNIALVDIRTYRAVESGQYTLRNAWIDHISPGFATSGGKAAAKIRDENGNVYSHEFTLNKRLRKIYKKDPEREFLVIRLYGKMYCLTEAPEAVQEEEAEMEMESEMETEEEVGEEVGEEIGEEIGTEEAEGEAEEEEG